MSLASLESLMLKSAGMAGRPYPLIIDTDMGNDVDDALALAFAHALQNRGLCEIRAVTLTHPSPDAALYIAALNTFYGRPDIPIGLTPDAPTAFMRSRYLHVARRKNEYGELLYPSDFDVDQAPGSIELLRKTLAQAEDKEIVIVQIGFSTNMARLLQSPPDHISPLSGVQLVEQKVKCLSAMAGMFPEDVCTRPEFNVRIDVDSALKLVKDWPTPIIWSGWDVGRAVRYPASSVEKDFNYTSHHIVKDSYLAYRPPPHERPCWDLTSIACVVWHGCEHFSLSPAGKVEIGEDKRTRFIEKDGGRDFYLKVDKTQAMRLRKDFAELVSECPLSLKCNTI